MGPIIAMGIGIVVYSLIDRRGLWFVSLTLTGAVLFVIGGVFLTRVQHDALRAIVSGLFLMICAFAPRIALPEHPVETGRPELKDSKNLIRVGIIDFVWISIMAASLAFVSFLSRSLLVKSPFTLVYGDIECRKKLLDIMIFFLGKTIDGFFVLGGVLGGCMAILWAGNIWRQTGVEQQRQYKCTTLAAIKMVIGFFFTGFTVLIWLGIPLCQNAFAVVASMR